MKTLQDANFAIKGLQSQVSSLLGSKLMTVEQMLANRELKVGDVVVTHCYSHVLDEGGAKYVISDTATEYSFPLANGLHALFNDVFDIRKFGIVSNETLDQTPNLTRLMRYADKHRVYVIDFLNYSIMTPDSLVGYVGVTSIVSGLWHAEAHHIKNLHIANDKTKELKPGKCCIIFAPYHNPTTTERVIYENIRLDPWVDNHTPWNQSIGAYDGLRLGIFAFPRDLPDGTDPLFITSDPDKATNYEFEFTNIEFLSAAHSYNISQGAIRSRRVDATNVSGDAFVHLNVDCVSLFAKNVTATVRYDLQEPGRQMMMDNIHYEAEHGADIRQSMLFNYDIISLDGCHTKNILKDGTVVDSGQTLWTTAFAPSIYKKILITNSSGNFENQSYKATYEDVEFLNCPDHIWYGCNHTNVVSVRQTDSVIQRKVGNNTGYIAPAVGTNVGTWTVTRCTYKSQFYYFLEDLPEAPIDKLIFDNIGIEYDVNILNTFSTNLIVNSLTLKNSDLPTVASAFVRYGSTIKEIVVQNVKFGKLDADPLIDLRYLDTTGSTKITLDNVTADRSNPAPRFLLSGLASYKNMDAKGFRSEIPRGVGSQTRGIDALCVTTA